MRYKMHLAIAFFKNFSIGFVEGCCYLPSAGISAAMHYALKDVTVGLFVYIIAVLIVSAVLWKTSAKIFWRDV